MKEPRTINLRQRSGTVTVAAAFLVPLEEIETGLCPAGHRQCMLARCWSSKYPPQRPVIEQLRRPTK